jgi:hypothetical protein
MKKKTRLISLGMHKQRAITAVYLTSFNYIRFKKKKVGYIANLDATNARTKEHSSPLLNVDSIQLD